MLAKHKQFWIKDKPTAYWTPPNLEKIAATFDERWYAVNYWRDLNDLKRPDERPLDFYLRVGGRLGHDPHRNFSELYFRTFNAELYAHLRSAPQDFGYLVFVDETWEKFAPWAIPTPSQCENWRVLAVAVDRKFVAAKYSIDQKKYVSALDYYIRCSRHSPISPSRSFSEAYYRSANPDVSARILRGELISGYHHFRLHGAHEGRSVRSVEDFEAKSPPAVGIGSFTFSRRLLALKNFLVRHRNRFG